MPDDLPSGLPARPPGPGAATWYAAGDLRFFLVSIRTLVLQVAHPMVGAAVGQHSVYKEDPYGRLWRTATSVIRQVYGGYRTSEEGRRLLEMHRDIQGVDDQGRRYSARNPAAYVWVHATLFDAWRLFLRDYARGLSDEQERQLFDEWRRIGLLIGCDDRLLPASVPEFDAWFAGMLDMLEDNAVVQDLLHNAPKAPPLVPQGLFAWLTSPLLGWQRSFVAETLPDGLAERFSLPRNTRTARHARRLGTFSRLLGLVPGLVRRSVLASWAMWRTSRDPRITPEPIRYP